MEIVKLIEAQRKFFNTDKTKSLDFRMDALQKLRNSLIFNEREILDALKSDLNKSDFEGYMSEIGMVRDEAGYIIKHLPKWIKNIKVSTPMAQFCSKSFIVPEPYGVVLIMSPWNYPLQLCLEPLIGALAAGNCAIIKPSAYAPATSKIVADIISKIYPPEYVSVVEGGRKENSELLDQKFDYIFFTGSVAVGKQVMESASKYLTPVSLELGGKSPTIVDKTANIPLAAKRIAFGKYLNAGQTCVAPDYILAHSSIKDQLIAELGKQIKAFFGSDPLSDKDLPKIINEKHFDRILGLMKDEKTVIGGRSNKESRLIEPTVLDGITFDSPVMQEEIFGPVLPIITFDDINEVIALLKDKPKPLALYLFSDDKAIQDTVLEKLSFGGGCINDTIIHLATSKMGFGGVGNSGMGSYHGKFSFDTFTHYKSIVHKKNWIDIPMRYHPYNEKNYSLIKVFLK
jgi:aldehyde dehydrogenase (NAD+)